MVCQKQASQQKERHDVPFQRYYDNVESFLILWYLETWNNYAVVKRPFLFSD